MGGRMGTVVEKRGKVGRRWTKERIRRKGKKNQTAYVAINK